MVIITGATGQLGLFHASRRGEFSTTDPTLQAVIGHPPVSLRSYLETVVAAG